MGWIRLIVLLFLVGTIWYGESKAAQEEMPQQEMAAQQNAMQQAEQMPEQRPATTPTPQESPEPSLKPPVRVKRTVLPQELQPATLADLSAQEVIAHMTHLLAARDIAKVASFMQELPGPTILTVLKEMIALRQRFSLTHRDFMHLIAVLAASPSLDSATQNVLLNLLLTPTFLKKAASVLVAAAQENNVPALKKILAWVRKPTTTNSSLLSRIQKMEYDAAHETVQKNIPAALQLLLLQGLSLSKEQALQLLWNVVDKARSPQLVPVLVSAGADINAHRQGYSLLMKAVDNNNLALVEELLKTPAIQINAMHKPEIGTALQIASRKGFVELDTLLRQKGAKEFVSSKEKRKRAPIVKNVFPPTSLSVSKGQGK